MKFRSAAALAALCCVASTAYAQNMSRVEVMALQQQLRDDGCGVQHVTGRMDAMTRRAVTKCSSKYNANGASADSLLNAMHIGFSAGVPAPSLSQARSGSAAWPGTKMNGGDSTMMRNRGMRRGRNGTMARPARRSMKRNGMMHDSTMKRNGMHDGTMKRNGMHDSTMKRNGMMHDSTMMRNGMMHDSTMMNHDSTMTNPAMPMNPATPATPANPTTPPTPRR